MHASSPPTSSETVSSWRTRIRHWSGCGFGQHEDKVLLVLTLVIGALVGLVIAAFIYVTENLGERMYPAGGSPWRRLLIPTAGSLVTGFLLSRYFPNARGSGIPQTKAALFLRDGFISFRTVLGKFGCSSISLASGIALGREGPSVHVGAGLASVLGRRLGLSQKRVRDLIPIGASAALAAAFNTPVAAVLFTLEEVMGDLHAPVLGSIVLSSATAWIVLHLLLGDEPLFHVPSYQLVSPIEFLTYAVLGVVGGVISVSFVKLLLFIRKRFLALPKWSAWMQPAAGGLLVGVMGWFVPEVLGVGYGHVSEALNGQMALEIMALLVVLKLVATAACYGTGNAGGIFGPSLFIGAMMGGAVGEVAHHLLPDYTGGVGAYALVGMGAAFAGIVRVPLASVIMIFEMTRDYSIIVPLMISNLISFYISYKLQREPIYEALQHQDGLHLPSGARNREPMPVVRDAAATPPHVFSPNDRFQDIVPLLGGERDAWPVADGQTLLCMVSSEQAREEVASGHGSRRLDEIPTAHLPSELLTNENFPHMHMDHPVNIALKRMAESRMNVLPVVSRANVRELQGVVTLNGILRAYGIGDEQNRAAKPVLEEPAASRFLLPGVIGAALALLMLIGFLNYYYRSERGARAEQYFKIGNDLARQNRDEEAIEQFRNALSASPGSEPYRLALGVELAKMGRLDEGAVYLNEVLKRDPENGAANLGLARIEARRQRTSNVVTYYHRALYDTWPAGQEQNRIQARFELADYLAKHRLKTQAIAELLAAMGQVRDDTARMRVAGLLLQYGAPREAADVFRDLVHGNSRDGAAYAGLGAAELAQDDYLAARNAFREALRLDPANEIIRKQLELCDQVLALDPDERGISALERYRRSQALIEGAVKIVANCAGGQASTQLIDAGRKALAARPNPGTRADITERNLTLAGEIWKSRPAACQAPASDETLERVLARLSR
jgi:chloride channel protein, CIC family